MFAKGNAVYRLTGEFPNVRCELVNKVDGVIKHLVYRQPDISFVCTVDNSIKMVDNDRVVDFPKELSRSTPLGYQLRYVSNKIIVIYYDSVVGFDVNGGNHVIEEVDDMIVERVVMSECDGKTKMSDGSWYAVCLSHTTIHLRTIDPPSPSNVVDVLRSATLDENGLCVHGNKSLDGVSKLCGEMEICALMNDARFFGYGKTIAANIRNVASLEDVRDVQTFRNHTDENFYSHETFIIQTSDNRLLLINVNKEATEEQILLEDATGVVLRTTSSYDLKITTRNATKRSCS